MLFEYGWFSILLLLTGSYIQDSVKLTKDKLFIYTAGYTSGYV